MASTLLSVEDALQRLLDSAVPVSRTETVSLMDAPGRVLANDLLAQLTHPAFDNSAMDGYAARHEDLATVGSKLTVIGESAAGRGFAGRVQAGQAVRIFTGAPVPEGADTVLIQEDAERIAPDRIRTLFAPQKGRHIRPRGQDFAQGDVVISGDVVLDAGRLTAAAGMNHALVPVYARAVVAILATGDELVAPGQTPGPNQIVASNSVGVAALARACGATIIDLGIVADDTTAITAAVEDARRQGADVLVTLGGASVGDHDLVQSALIGCGMTLDFWRIAMRPGKPLMVGKLGAMHVLGLPGNPVSSLVCALLFLQPLLLKLARLPRQEGQRKGVSATALPENDKRQDYIRAHLTRDKTGGLVAHAFTRQDSSMMAVFASADALIVRPPQAPALAAGEACGLIVLREPMS